MFITKQGTRCWGNAAPLDPRLHIASLRESEGHCQVLSFVSAKLQAISDSQVFLLIDLEIAEVPELCFCGENENSQESAKEFPEFFHYCRRALELPITCETH